jgi:hypothetical protein
MSQAGNTTSFADRRAAYVDRRAAEASAGLTVKADAYTKADFVKIVSEVGKVYKDACTDTESVAYCIAYFVVSYGGSVKNISNNDIKFKLGNKDGDSDIEVGVGTMLGLIATTLNIAVADVSLYKLARVPVVNEMIIAAIPDYRAVNSTEEGHVVKKRVTAVISHETAKRLFGESVAAESDKVLKNSTFDDSLNSGDNVLTF